MRKLNYLLGFGLMVGLLTSCAADESIDSDNDVNPDGKYTVNYAVQVVPIGDVSRGVNNATVTIQTQNGVTTKTVGEDGIAVFENVSAGTVSGYVSSPGFASVNFKAAISFQNVDVNTNGYVSSTVYIPATNATVSGRIFGDYDLDGNTSLSDGGNFQVVNLFVRYTTGFYPMGTGDGALTQMSLDYSTYAEVSVANGDFSIDSLPNTDLSYFGAVLYMEDVKLVDAVSLQQVIVNIGAYGLSLQPGETLELGDLYAN